MLALSLKVLVPLILVVVTAIDERKRQPAKSMRVFAKRTGVSVAIALGTVGGLVADHVNQTAAVATARAEALAAQAALGRIEESAAEQAATSAATQEEAAQARQALQRLEDATAEVVTLVREQNPNITAQDALAIVAEELGRLRARSDELQNQLTGLMTYRDVAELNLLGLRGLAGPGSGLRESSQLSRAMEGAWLVSGDSTQSRCDPASLAKFSAVTESHPTFPFSHAALSACAFDAGDSAWAGHAERAMDILRHTVQIAGHHRHHDDAYRFLQGRLDQRSEHPSGSR